MSFEQGLIATVFGIVGSTLLGYHFGSWLVGIGIYLCIASIGNWRS